MYNDVSHFKIESCLPPNYSEMKLLGEKKPFKENKLQIPLGWSA